MAKATASESETNGPDLADPVAAQDEAGAEPAADSGDPGEAEPSQKKVGNKTAYSAARLIADAESFLGHPAHVVAGALHGVEQEYFTLDEARERVITWLQEEVG